MAYGRWKRGTYELIKVSRSGFISDGQHRLCAVIKANKNVPFHFKFNLDDSVFDVLDTGSVRSAADVFKIQGIKNDNTIPSIIQTYFSLASGNASVKNGKLTNAQILIEYENNPEFWQEVARKTATWYTQCGQIMPPSLIGGFFAFFNSKNEVMANDFMTQLTTGFGITNDVIMMLRNKLVDDKLAKRKMSPSDKLAIIIKTWNAYRTGKSFKILKIGNQESFPVAI